MQNFSDLFPQNHDISYLNHAAVSPWPKAAVDAAVAFARENGYQGARDYPHWLKTEAQLRQRLCKLLGTSDTAEIALAKSTSEALSMIAYGLRWKTGDEIIITNQEFPSNRIVWESLYSRGVTVVVADISNKDPIAAIADCITNRTRMISVSSVQYASGLKMDLERLGAICRDSNVLLCIDAIQSLGATPFDQLKIQADFIVADGHKWMMAAEGLALFYIKQERQHELQLNEYGWHMVKDRGNYDRIDWEPAEDATRFECGSPNMMGTHILNASLKTLLDIGMETIHEQLQKRMDYLTEQLLSTPDIDVLSPMDPDQRSGIVTFRPRAECDLSTLHKQLMERGVICAQRGGGIRFSPHFYTTPEAIDKAINELKVLVHD